MQVRLALLAMVTFFGGSMPAYKIAGRSFGPATANLARFVIASAFLAFIARKRFGSARGHAKKLVLIGMFGIGLMAVCLGVGVDRGSATIGSVVIALEPIGVALAGAAIVGDRPSRRSVVALVIGVVGAFIASGVFTERSVDTPYLAIVLLLGTVVTFSVYTALVRREAKGIDPLAVASLTQLGALAFVIPACLFDLLGDGMIRANGIRADAVWSVVFLGVGSALGYLLLIAVLANQPSSRVAVSMFLTPIIGVVLSWLVVGEHLNVRVGVGAALVLVAVWISEGSNVRRKRALSE